MQNEIGPSSFGRFIAAKEPASPGGPSSSNPSFAGLMASLSAPHTLDSTWSDDQLADDVAIISYERALRGKIRSCPTNSGPCSGAAQSKNGIGHTVDPNAASRATPKPLKTTSITIRLSEPECAQLRLRAAEAGMTVSAYLRSCTLEVESLRAQVKQALAELRNSAPKPCGLERESEMPGQKQSLSATFRRWLKLIRPGKVVATGLNSANPIAPGR